MNKQEIIEFLTLHKKELYSEYGVTRIGIFGSYARGEMKKDSDIDIAVEIESENKYRSFFGLKRYLEQKFETKVDLGIESTLKPVAKRNISKEIIYV